VKLVVLDIGLPDIDGFEVCRRIGGRVPVIMLTARDELPDRIAGLELGADDYVVKPFSPRELTARIAAVLRRGRSAALDDVVELGPVTLARAAREVRVNGSEVELTQCEFLLEVLLRHAGQVVTRDQLLACTRSEPGAPGGCGQRQRRPCLPPFHRRVTCREACP
jgi:DNA-binding response OmpR family regulator